MTNAEREAHLFEHNDETFALQAPGAVRVLLNEGDLEAARRLVHRIRDERGVGAVCEVVRYLGWGSELGHTIMGFADLTPEMSGAIVQATIDEETAQAKLTNADPVKQLSWEMKRRREGWQTSRIRVTRPVKEPVMVRRGDSRREW